MKGRPAVRCVTSLDEQLALWVAGESVHLTIPGRKRGTTDCCPDFSCCQPHLLQPLEMRQRYVKADERHRRLLLLRFVRALCNANGIKVNVIG